MSFSRLAPILAVLLAPAAASAQWPGFVDASAELGTDGYPFSGAVPGAGPDERWTDAQLADFDGDGAPDLMVGARFGLLRNTLGGQMAPVRALVGWRQRGDFGATGWGDDVFRFVDVDGDDDLDVVQGGSGQSLACQENVAWRWRERWVEPGLSALDIVPLDVEGDGDVDLVVTMGACAQGPCGEPVELSLLINDGSGDFTEQSATRGLTLGAGQTIVDVTAGDLDRDGDIDIVTQRGDPTGSSVHVSVNDGLGSFVSQVFPIPTSCVGRGRSSALGDLDRDGSLDLVIARCATGQAPDEWAGPYAGGHPTIAHVVAFGGGGGFFDRSSTFFDASGHPDELAGTEVALADVDNDGDLDLLVLRLAGGGGELSHQLQVFLNQTFGRLAYSTTHSFEIPATASPGAGSLDVVDLDGDGDQDVVLGFEGDGAHIYLNRAVEPGQPPEDVPVDLTLLAHQGPVVLAWSPPIAASPVRYFRVYRSLADRMHVRDRELIAVVGASRHLDTGFYGMIDERTIDTQLGDPNASIQPGTRRVMYRDTTAREGVGYFYSVTTVGPGHVESAPTPEVFARIPATIPVDTQPPRVTILTPTEQDWQRAPRVAVAFGDELSEVDPDSIHVSFDVPLGDLLAGANLADALEHRRDADAFVAHLEPPYVLPADTTVTMLVRVSDRMGNERTEQVSFTTTAPDAPQPTPTAPVAVFAPPTVTRAAPVTIRFDGTGSTDPDGELFRHEWYVRSTGGSRAVADDPIAYGARAEHFFAYGGNYTITLLVRDADGNVGSATRDIILLGPTRADAGPAMVDAGPPFDAGPPMPQCGSRTCGTDPQGFSCGTCGPRQICEEPQFQCVCAPGEMMCGAICGVDLQSDREHCGSCFTRCAVGSVCNAGSCEEGPPIGGCGCRAVADPTRPSPPAPLLWLLLVLGLRYLPTAARRSSTIVSAMR